MKYTDLKSAWVCSCLLLYDLKETVQHRVLTSFVASSVCCNCSALVCARAFPLWACRRNTPQEDTLTKEITFKYIVLMTANNNANGCEPHLCKLPAQFLILDGKGVFLQDEILQKFVAEYESDKKISYSALLSEVGQFSSTLTERTTRGVYEVWCTILPLCSSLGHKMRMVENYSPLYAYSFLLNRSNLVLSGLPLWLCP